MKKHILVIDDELLYRNLYKRILEKKGYYVDASHNGKDAMSKIESIIPDLVITDIIMPDMDGLELIREIRAKFPNVKIMAVSGGGRIKPDVYLKMASKLKADCILEKPFSNNDLLDKINSLI